MIDPAVNENAVLTLVMGVLAFAAVIIAIRYGVLWYYDRRARAAQIKCPDCASWIPREARVCRHCGHRLENT